MVNRIRNKPYRGHNVHLIISNNPISISLPITTAFTFVLLIKLYCKEYGRVSQLGINAVPDSVH